MQTFRINGKTYKGTAEDIETLSRLIPGYKATGDSSALQVFMFVQTEMGRFVEVK